MRTESSGPLGIRGQALCCVATWVGSRSQEKARVKEKGVGAARITAPASASPPPDLLQKRAPIRAHVFRPGPWPVLPQSAACLDNRRGWGGGCNGERGILQAHAQGSLQGEAEARALVGPTALKAAAFRPTAGLGFVLRSPRSCQGERAFFGRPHGSSCCNPRHTSAANGEGGRKDAGCTSKVRCPSQGETRLPGRIPSHSRPWLTISPRASSLSSTLLGVVGESADPPLGLATRPLR
ncbi:hypothetical protein NDU88_004323 [Pleurodeles waltl]|uniref:Uncharacterized protein n=1 Tax=Pleurodeles waltl TaxID=8319 RepID=A0AAV7N2P3_PLEWA|nr:hypothetical protein NDU88_004323 [Pleurodeles waltl]